LMVGYLFSCTVIIFRPHVRVRASVVEKLRAASTR
jgi:hypothetical protein